MSYNLLYYKTSDNSLTQYNSTDLAQLSEYVLELMASGTYAGTITVSSSNPIGTFVDTVRVSGVGGTNITILSNTYTLSQVNSVQSTVDPPMYVGVTTSGSDVTIKENATSLNDLADEIIQSLVSNYGVNSYYLGTSAPADGGTWVSRGSLLDTLQNFTVTNTEYKLWHKIASSSYTSYKAPLKIDSGAGNLLKEWSSTEVSRLIKKIEERIINTGIGTYALQTSAPSTGTWALVGTINDVRRDVNVDPVYTGLGATYTVTYQSDTQPTYTGPSLDYTLTYEGTTSVFYTDIENTFVSTTFYTSTTNYLTTSLFIGGSGEFYILDTPSIPAVYTGPNSSPGNYLLKFYDALIEYTFGENSIRYTSVELYEGESPPELYSTIVNFTGFNFVYTGLVKFEGIADYTSEIIFIGDAFYDLDTSYSSFLEYQGLVPTNFEGISYTADSSYTGPNIINNYDSTEFIDTATYTGPSLVTASTSTISTVSLWKRIS